MRIVFEVEFEGDVRPENVRHWESSIARLLSEIERSKEWRSTIPNYGMRLSEVRRRRTE